MTFEELKKSNPFYHQHVFNHEDTKRSVATWRDKMRFWFIPSCVQITDDGVVFFKQNRHGEILIIKWEPLPRIVNLEE